MSSADELDILQMPGTFMARSGGCVGQTIVVYLRGVHAPLVVEMPGPCPPAPCPPGVPGPCPPGVPEPSPPEVCPPPVRPTGPGMTGPAGSSPGIGPGFGGPPLTPGVPPGGGHVTPFELLAGRWESAPCPESEMGTTILSGTLAFAGADYLVLRIAMNGCCADILVPYMAIGMAVACGMAV
ncbi:MAG: hypothetical protein ACOX3V_00925 [Bacillota bacterium]|jgi:hypothetical protein